MALGTITVSAQPVKSPMANIQFVDISFAGDDDYHAGGSTTFKTLVAAKIARDLTIAYVIPIGACGGYVPVYDKAGDKLLVFYGNYAAAAGPLIEVPDHTSLAGVTFKLCVVGY